MTLFRYDPLTSNYPIDPRDDARNRELGAEYRRLEAMALAIAILKSIDQKPPLFHLGQIVATPGALHTLDKWGQNANELLVRHAAGDFGEISEQLRKQNVWAICHEEQILSSYKLGPKDEILWIITEFDRSATTLLLPEER